jgi:hypothetical protein
MDEPPLLQKMLSQLGLTRSLSKIKFGGVVGKQTLLGIALCVGLSAVAIRSSDRYVRLLAITFMFLAGLSIVAGNLWYAHKHPAEATEAGFHLAADFVLWTDSAVTHDQDCKAARRICA